MVATGNPGAGKSSLLRAAAQLAKVRGRRVLSVTPTQFDQGLPFAGLAELIGQFPEGADSGLPGPQRRALAVALQRAEPDRREADALAVRGLLTQLTESGPVALIVDDVQWLDHESVGSLGFALRRISVEPHRLSVLVTTRPDPGAGADLIRCLPGPRREFSLPPLENWAIGQLLRQRLGPRWTLPVSAGVAGASGGNPFLALEIARAMQADLPSWRGSAQHGHDPVVPVPPSLAELLRERVARLPQDSREVLLLVSAAGRLTVAQLQWIVEEARLWPALEAAADGDIAIVSAESVVAFTHPLLASAIYDAAAPAERRRAHRVLAESLGNPVERARHCSRSIVAPDEAVAGELERAAEISRSRGAPQLAGGLMERAALATPSEADTAASLGRWLRAVSTYIDAGDQVAAHAALDKASALAAVPEQQAQMLERLAKLADHYSGMRSLAEQALRLAPKGTEVRAKILLGLCSVHRMEGNGKEALRLGRMAVEEAAAVKRQDVQLAALNELLACELHWGKGQPEQSLRDIKRLAASSAPDLPTAQIASGMSTRPSAFFAKSSNDPDLNARSRRPGSRLALGQFYRRAGYKGMASEALNAAAVAFEELGIPRWAQRARDEASRVGLHPTTSTLTETERRVAELVGSGR